MSTIRDDLKQLIDTLSERQILALWRVAASMKPSETLTPEEAARVDQALRGDRGRRFCRLAGSEACPLGYVCRAKRNGIWSEPTRTRSAGSLPFSMR